jgi:hypothetical protein
MPEDDGIPCFLIYSPRATIKMRCESIAGASQFLTMFYGRESEQIQHVHTKEWALIASIDGGKVPSKDPRSSCGTQDLLSPHSFQWNKEIFEAGVATQPYGAGLGEFTSKFKPKRPYSSTIAIEKGCHGDHGSAIFFEQEVRRCTISSTLYGLTDDEAFWYTMQAWAKFQPRLAKPRQDPGLLSYPAEYTHVIQKYWDVLSDPITHPDCNKTDHTKSSMREMASALRNMDSSSWEPQVDAEASEKSYRVSRIAALSRRCPIRDAADYWNPVESQVEAVTDLGGPAPSQDGHNVDT